MRDLAANKSVHIGDTRFDAYQPAFSPDGKYLYYLGNREWAPQLSNIEWNFATNRDTGIFALTLRKGLDDPFAPRNDSAIEGRQEGRRRRQDDDKDKGDDKSKDKPKSASEIDDRIDFDGIDQRLVRAPIDPDNIQWIAVTGKSLLYVVSDAQYYGRDGAFKPKLKAWSFEDRKSEDVFEGVDDISLAADGNTVLVRNDKAYKRIDLTASKPEAEGRFDRRAVRAASIRKPNTPRSSAKCGGAIATIST